MIICNKTMKTMVVCNNYNSLQQVYKTGTLLAGGGDQLDTPTFHVIKLL